MNLDSWGMFVQLLSIIFVMSLFFGFIAFLGYLWRKFLAKLSGKGHRQNAKVSQRTHEKQLKKLDKVYGTFTISKIDKMTGTEFELFVEKLFRVLEKDKFQKTEFTPSSGDQGCDLVINYKDGSRLGIQCKRYSGNVGNTAIQNIVTAKAMYGLTRTMVITNSYYTPGAKEAARSNRVELVDRGQLIEMINRYNDIIRTLHAKN